MQVAGLMHEVLHAYTGMNDVGLVFLAPARLPTSTQPAAQSPATWIIIAVLGQPDMRIFRYIGLLSLCVLTVVTVRAAWDVKSVSTNIWDQSRVVSAKEFGPENLKIEFQRFVDTACAGRRLARLMVAPTEQDLSMSIDVMMPFDSIGNGTQVYSNWTRANPGMGMVPAGLSVAEVICFSGNATVFVRRGGRFSTYQIRGSVPANEFVVSSTRFSLAGFRFSDQVPRMYVRSATLPTLPAANLVREFLERSVGGPVTTYFRTDSVFWIQEGPAFDPFEISQPRVDADAFLKRPFLACLPSTSGHPCSIEHN